MRITQSHLGEGVAEILIDNPRHRNAITAAMWRRLPLLLDELAHDETVRVLVIRGAGTHFSAGAHVNELDDILLDPVLPLGGLITPAEDALARFPRPTIAAIDGICYGGGWEIAAACDLRVATASARFAVTPARLGIAYPASGIARLVQLVGPGVAKDLLLTAREFSAAEALEVGMLTSVVDAAGLDGAIHDLADRMRANSPLAMHAAKELVDAAVQGRQWLEHAESTWQIRIAESTDHVEGRAAFRESRRPRFRPPATPRVDSAQASVAPS